MRLQQWLFAVLITVLLPGIASAAWLEASSAHFVVYANDRESDLQLFSQQLERFNAAMSLLTNRRLDDLTPSNRVTVYVVGSQQEVLKLYGGTAQNVGAFYIPRAGRSMAIVQSIVIRNGELDFSMIALLHEYAHHFINSTSDFTPPRWYSEGSAEFFASARFYKDGGIEIGTPANHRGGDLTMARDVTATQLLDPTTYVKRGGSYDAYYGKSWLLLHYLTFNAERRGQLGKYVALLAGGMDSRKAGMQAFGDFEVLEKELDKYLVQPRMAAFKVPAASLVIGPISIRALDAGEVAIMPARIRSWRGVNPEQAKEVLAEARAIAARYPDNAAVLSALAEAEYDTGNDREAIAAADAAIASDPRQVNAYVQKGYGLFRLAKSDPDPPAAYRRARAPFLALNRLENDHPLPLLYNYLSFEVQGQVIPDNALDGLRRAAEIAPFDMGLRMTLAAALVRRREFAEARLNLGPVAYNPHGGQLATAAQRVIARIDSTPDWDGKDLQSVVETADEESSASGDGP